MKYTNQAQPLHDSILWINDKEVTKVTASEMIYILSEIGEAYQVEEERMCKEGTG